MSGLILILTVSHLVRAVHGQVLREGERVDSGWSLHLIHKYFTNRQQQVNTLILQICGLFCFCMDDTYN